MAINWTKIFSGLLTYSRDLEEKSLGRKLAWGIIDRVDTTKWVMNVRLFGSDDPLDLLENVPIRTMGSPLFGLKIVPHPEQVVYLLKDNEGYVHIGDIILDHENHVIDLSQDVESMLNSQLRTIPKLNPGDIFVYGFFGSTILLDNTGDIEISTGSSRIQIHREMNLQTATADHYTKQTSLKSYEEFGKYIEYDESGVPSYDKNKTYDEHKVVLNPDFPFNILKPQYYKYITKEKVTDYNRTEVKNSNNSNVQYFERINLSDLGLSFPELSISFSKDGMFEIKVNSDITAENFIRIKKDGVVPGNFGTIDLNGELRLATEKFVLEQFNKLVEFIMKHQHVGNNGAPTPLFPAHLQELIQLYAQWVQQQQPIQGSVLTTKVRGE